MRRVVISGLGVVSCLGNSQAEVLDSLRQGRSGISFNEGFAEKGLRSQVCGSVAIDTADFIDRKVRRFMGDAAAYSYIAMQQAIDDAGLDEADVSNPRSGLIAASGGASSSNIVISADTLRAKGVRRIGPYMVPRTMCWPLRMEPLPSMAGISTRPRTCASACSPLPRDFKESMCAAS